MGALADGMLFKVRRAPFRYCRCYASTLASPCPDRVGTTFSAAGGQSPSTRLPHASGMGSLYHLSVSEIPQMVTREAKPLIDLADSTRPTIRLYCLRLFTKHWVSRPCKKRERPRRSIWSGSIR